MRLTTPKLVQMKGKEKIAMLTCYDATFARLLDDSGIHAMLVGDSLGMVIKGEDDTLNVTVDEIAYHVRAVSKGSQRSHIVADMPFMSYQSSDAMALRNAGKLIQAGAQSVKLEGGYEISGRIRKIVSCGIPVMAHVGMTPQSVHAFGGFRLQGRTEEARKRILHDALAVESAGAFAVVLECIDADLAAEISARLSIPTIGIGAGPHCDGQVLVVYDILNLDHRFKAKFVKRFFDAGKEVKMACSEFAQAVKTGQFPEEEHSFYTMRNGANKKEVLKSYEQAQQKDCH